MRRYQSGPLTPEQQSLITMVGDRYAVATISTRHPDFPNWREPVVVSLRDRAGEVEVVGIERPRNDPNSRP